jgi:hypothetical protein
MEMLKGINISEKVLFGGESPCNSKYSWLQVFPLLVKFPCFMIKDRYNYKQSALSNFFGCKKDVFIGLLVVILSIGVKYFTTSMINRPEELAHFVDYNNLKAAV